MTLWGEISSLDSAYSAGESPGERERQGGVKALR
jgi:hypothetical protein